MTSKELISGEYYHIKSESGSEFYLRVDVVDNYVRSITYITGGVRSNGTYTFGLHYNFTHCSSSYMSQLFPQYFKSEINNTYEIY